MVQLAEDVILAQRLLNVAKARFDVCRAEVEEIATVRGDSGQRRARLTLGLVCVGKGEEAAEVGVTAQIAGEQQVRKLVAGPGVFICDGCIELCSEVLREDEHPTAPGSFRQHPSSLRARISCWFRNLLQVRGYST